MLAKNNCEEKKKDITTS